MSCSSCSLRSEKFVSVVSVGFAGTLLRTEFVLFIPKNVCSQQINNFLICLVLEETPQSSHFYRSFTPRIVVGWLFSRPLNGTDPSVGLFQQPSVWEAFAGPQVKPRRARPKTRPRPKTGPSESEECGVPAGCLFGWW